MLFSVEQAFVGREEIRAPLKTPAWEARVFQEIVAYQELFCVVTLLSELERPRQRRRKRGHIKSNRFPIKVVSQGLYRLFR